MNEQTDSGATCNDEHPTIVRRMLRRQRRGYYALTIALHLARWGLAAPWSTVPTLRRRRCRLLHLGCGATLLIPGMSHAAQMPLPCVQ